MVCFCYHPLNGVWSVDCIQYKSIHIVKIYTRISAFFINLDHSFIPLACAECYRFLAVLRSFFHSSLLYTLSFHPFPPTSLPSSLSSSCHLFLGLPLSLVVSTLILILFGEFYFLPFSVHAQTNVIYLTLMSTMSLWALKMAAGSVTSWKTVKFYTWTLRYERSW